MNFIDSLVSDLKDNPKQVYPDALAAEPVQSGPNPTGGPSSGPPPPPGTDPPPPPPPGADLPPHALEAEAEVWIETTDFLLSETLGFYSTTGETDKFRASESGKKQLKHALVRWFATMEKAPQLPPWMIFAGLMLIIYGPKFAEADAKRKGSKKAKKDTPPAGDSAPKSPPPTGAPAAPVANPVQTDGPVFTGAPDENGDVKLIPFKPITDDPFFRRHGRANPIDAHENYMRKKSGGKLCPECEVNYTKKGVNTCSTICNGKRAGRLNTGKPKKKRNGKKSAPVAGGNEKG
jgi:hypothetical protein